MGQREDLAAGKDLGLVQLPLLDKLRIRNANYTWQFLSQPSVIDCRTFLQPELHRFLYVGSSSQSLAARERTRWGKFKQSRSGKAVCGELCLWWHKRMSNFHVPVPFVFMHVPSVSCLRTMEQTFINLLTPELNAPWVQRLLKSKHSIGTKTDPVRPVRRQLVSWRQFNRYRCRALISLCQAQPSVFRSPKIVGAIVYALQLLFDLASDSSKSFLAHKFLRSNYVDADTVYHLYRAASHLGDPFYETLCRSTLSEILRFRQLPVPRPCVPLCMHLLLPQRKFVRTVRNTLNQCLDVSDDRFVPYHIPTTRVIAASHPKIKDILHNHMAIVRTWTSDGNAEQMGWNVVVRALLNDIRMCKWTHCLFRQPARTARWLSRVGGLNCKQCGISSEGGGIGIASSSNDQVDQRS